jgi:site-specific DNA recombinase
VWKEVIRLLDDPLLIQGEIDRRMEAARMADPLRKREQSLRQQHTRLENNIARLVTAYQEELITLTELRQRIPNLRKQQQTVESQLRSLAAASEDQSRYLRLAETLSEFRGRLRSRAETLDVIERQKILRLVVQEIIVGTDTIRIRHSIPIADSRSGPNSGSPFPSNAAAAVQNEHYLLRTWSRDTTLRCSGFSANELLLG